MIVNGSKNMYRSAGDYSNFGTRSSSKTATKRWTRSRFLLNTKHIQRLSSDGCKYVERGDSSRAVCLLKEAYRCSCALTNSAKFTNRKQNRVNKLQAMTAINTAAAFLAIEKPSKALIWLKKAHECITIYEHRSHSALTEMCDLYVNYAAAYEQLNQWEDAKKSILKVLGMLKLEKSRSNKLSSGVSIQELIAETSLRLSVLSELTKPSPPELSKSWKTTFDDLIHVAHFEGAAVSALKAVRWLIASDVKHEIDDCLDWAKSSLMKLPQGFVRGKYLNELGLEFMTATSFPGGIDCFQAAYNDLLTYGPGITAPIQQNIGTAQAAAGSFHVAADSLQKAAQQYDKTNLHAGCAQVHCNLGYVYACLTEWKKSQWHYTLAKQVAEKVGAVAIAAQATEAINLLFAGIRNVRSQKFHQIPVALALCPAKGVEGQTDGESQENKTIISTLQPPPPCPCTTPIGPANMDNSTTDNEQLHSSTETSTESAFKVTDMTTTDEQDTKSSNLNLSTNNHSATASSTETWTQDTSQTSVHHKLSESVTPVAYKPVFHDKNDGPESLVECTNEITPMETPVNSQICPGLAKLVNRVTNGITKMRIIC